MQRSFIWVLFLCFVFPLGCEREQPEGNQKLNVKKSEGILINDVRIATFPTPDGWTPNRSSGNTAVILMRVGANRQDPKEVISIDIGKPVSPDVQASANSLASEFSGTASLLPFQVDGEPAYRVSIPPNYKKIMPRECIVVHHDGQVCFFFGGSKSQADIWPSLSTVAQSWKWK